MWLHGYLATMTIFMFSSILIVIKTATHSRNLYDSICVVFLVIISLSWILAGKNIIIFLAFSSFVYFLIKKRNIEKIQISFDKIKSISKDFDYSIALLILIFISLNAIETNSGYFLHDKFHPIYEHAMGHSFSNSLLNAPDLSFYGKDVSWHFLSTQISKMFENFGINYIRAIYTVTPSILFIIFFILFKQICQDSNNLRLSGLLFFFPLGYFSLLDRLVSFTTSMSVSSIIILLCYHYFKQKEYLIYFILSIILCFTKTSHFLVLLGFIFLKFMMGKSNNRILYLYLTISQAIILVISYILYFNDAHTYNNWIILGFLKNFLAYRDFMYVIIPLAILVYLARNILQNTKNKLYNSELIAISGLIGYIFLIESTESNHNYFILASLPFIIISLVKRNFFKVNFFILIWIIFTLSYYPINRSGLSKYITKPINHFIIKAKELINDNQSSGGYIDLSLEKKNLYSKLKSITINDNCVVWFPIIYETDYNFLRTTGEYFPLDGFFRSSISNKQFFLENMKYKNILLEEDFPLRFAQSLIWYKNFIDPSVKNKKKYDLLMDILKHKNSNSNNEEHMRGNISDEIIEFFSTNKNNQYNKALINLKMSDIFKKTKNLDNKSYGFDDKISHIVLEDGDKFKRQSLKNSWKLIYSNSKSQIWERENLKK